MIWNKSQLMEWNSKMKSPSISCYRGSLFQNDFLTASLSSLRKHLIKWIITRLKCPSPIILFLSNALMNHRGVRSSYWHAAFQLGNMGVNERSLSNTTITDLTGPLYPSTAWRSLAGLHLQQCSLLQITTMKELMQQSIPNVKTDKPQHLNCHT